jgi:hypothetical protein
MDIFKREDPLDVLPQYKDQNLQSSKGFKARKLYLRCPSKWRKMHVFGLVVALSSNKPEK